MKLDPQDISSDPKFKQDEFNRVDEELKQLEMVSIALKKQPNYFVESLITGQFFATHIDPIEKQR